MMLDVMDKPDSSNDLLLLIVCGTRYIEEGISATDGLSYSNSDDAAMYV